MKREIRFKFHRRSDYKWMTEQYIFQTEENHPIPRGIYRLVSYSDWKVDRHIGSTQFPSETMQLTEGTAIAGPSQYQGTHIVEYLARCLIQLGATKTIQRYLKDMARTKEYGDEPFVVCHWDTFDGGIFRVGGAQTLAEAEEIVQEKYGDRIRNSGADKVDIIDESGKIVRQYSVC